MSRQLTLTCDRCKRDCSILNTDTFENELFTIAFSFDSVRQEGLGNTYRKVPDLKAEWCRTCLNEFKLLKGMVSHNFDTPEKANPTIEAIIRTIVQEEIDNGNS